MIPFDLTQIKALCFDVDGVLSAAEVILLPDDPQPVRTANIKDGYALHLAAQLHFPMAIITGGKSPAVRRRYEMLGLTDVFDGVSVKIDCFRQWCERAGFAPSEVLYMGDDIPDLQVMQACGLPVCPADAAPEVKQVAVYVSPYKGGAGCVRDVVEQVLKAHGLWMSNAEAFGW